MEGSLVPRIRFALLDCGHKVGVGVSFAGRRHAWRVRNPFRVALSDGDFHAGKPLYRWPFGAASWAIHGR